MRLRILLALTAVLALCATAEAGFRDRIQERREARRGTACGSCQTPTVAARPPAYLPDVRTAGYSATPATQPTATLPGCASGSCQPAPRGLFRVR